MQQGRGSFVSISSRRVWSHEYNTADAISAIFEMICTPDTATISEAFETKEQSTLCPNVKELGLLCDVLGISHGMKWKEEILVQRSSKYLRSQNRQQCEKRQEISHWRDAIREASRIGINLEDTERSSNETGLNAFLSNRCHYKT